MCVYLKKKLIKKNNLRKTPRTIVGTEEAMKVLLPEYQVCKCFIILNNYVIQNYKL